MKKRVRFTLEVEFQNDGITDEVVRDSWSHYSNYEDYVADKENWEQVEYQKRLLDVLLSDKMLLERFLKFRIMSEIEGLDHRSLQRLTETINQDELTVLQEATKKLNYVDKAFFDQVIEAEVLSENTYVLSDSFKIVSRKIEIETVGDEADLGTSQV